MPYRATEQEAPNRFAGVMARRTSDDLYLIANGPASDWDPEAIEAARRELERRGLTAAEREELAEHLEEATEAARAPLEPWKRPVALAAGAMGALGLILLMHLDRKHLQLGEKEKSKEMRTWFLYGLALHALLFVVCRSC